MEKEEFRLKYEQFLFIVDRKGKKSGSGSGILKSQNIPTENAPGKVQLSNLQDLGLELKYKLQLERIDIEKIDSLLFNPEIQKKNSITIEELEEISQRKPFFIDNLKNMENLIRFLMEEEDRPQSSKSAKSNRSGKKNSDANLGSVKS